MSACCIGGVCIPQSAILPLVVIALKWIAVKLASYGMLPDSISKKLGINPTTSTTTTMACSSSSCCQGECSKEEEEEEKKSDDSKPSSKEVEDITSLEQYHELRCNTTRTLVVKFTADWCKPCHKIDPFYQRLASKYDGTFVRVNVDDFDEIASECSVGMMPTFVFFGGGKKGGEEVGRMSGIDEGRLEGLVSGCCSMR